MRYMMLIYSQENEAAPLEDMRAVAAAHKSVMEEARARGIFRVPILSKPARPLPRFACRMARRSSPTVRSPKPRSS